MSTMPLAPDSRGPLSGVRVLDLSAYIAGPYGCTLLADQGAEVLKIEPPSGDNLRNYPSTLPGESRAFLGVNRSKRGMVLDLQREADRQDREAEREMCIEQHKELSAQMSELRRWFTPPQVQGPPRQP